MLILKGEGSNGKSVLMEIARQLVGEANTTSAMLDRLTVPHVRSTIDKKLLNQSADLPKLRQVADGDFKAIISGDSVEASAKYKPSATFKPYVRLMVATNNMPHSKDTTDGYFRRLIVLSFNRQFAESQRDPNLLAKLKAEMPGIVAWAVEGARMLRERGRLSVPPSSNQEVRTYREELSPPCPLRRVP
jgi:putative DNA primase/helicase